MTPVNSIPKAGDKTSVIPNLTICGIDEAGRGALAGPVCAAAVQLGRTYPHDMAALLADSKQLSADQRTARAAEIIRHASRWAISWATAHEVDEHNVLRATLLAMRRAYLLLCGMDAEPRLPIRSVASAVGGWAYSWQAPPPAPQSAPQSAPAPTPTLPLPQCVIIDGPHVPPLIDGIEVHGVVRADTTIAAVQAASILAKTHRDAWMQTRAHRHFPQYGFAQHKGYPTALHRQMIVTHGASPIHRISFNGVRTNA